jgi:GPH family glycoside/pentoside/hexuronide:cation symporter
VRGGTTAVLRVETGDERSRPALYGIGALGASLLLQTILLWIVYFYAPPAGQGTPRLPPPVAGLALAGGRIVNALTNPPVAYWSDRIRSRWGRRRPFIALGAPALAACFALLWIPPAAPPQATFVYALATLAGFFFCFSLVMNPYAALLPDIAPGGPARVAAASWQAAASLGGVGAAMTVSSWLIARWGFGAMGLALGASALVLLWAVAAGVPDPPPAARVSAGFAGSLATVLRNRAFGVYLVSLTLLWLGTSMVNSTIVYDVTVLMGLPADRVGLVLGAAFVCALGALPLLSAASRRLGTARELAWTLGVSSAILPLVATIGLPGLPLRPAVQGYVLVVLSAVPLAGLLVLPNTLLADIAEADRLAGGEGHEAMFYAVQGLVLNAATAVSAAALGELLTLGDSPGHALGLRIIPVTAGTCTLLALLVFRRFTPPRRPAHRGTPSGS